MNLGRAWIAVLLTTTACSSSSSPSSETETDAGKSRSGSTSTVTIGEQGNPPPPAPAPEKCTGHGVACEACCEDAVQGGAEFFRLSEVSCACHGKGSCSDVCTETECDELRSRYYGACQECLQPLVAGGCADQAKQACAADSTCSTYLACVTSCQ